MWWVVLAWLTVVAAMQREYNISIGTTVFGNFEQFGFLPDGTSNFTVFSNTDDLLYVFICDSHDHYQLVDKSCAKILRAVADQKLYDLCEVVHPFRRHGSSFHEYNKFANYYFDVANCNEEMQSLRIYYETINPGGTQLSSDEIPQLTIYLMLMVFWVVLLGCQLGNAVWQCRQSLVVVLLLAIFSVLKIMWSCIVLWDLQVQASVGKIDSTVHGIYSIVYVVGNAYPLTTLMMLSNGYAITNRSLPRKLVIVGYFAICVAVGLAKEYLDDISMIWKLGVSLVYIIVLAIPVLECYRALRVNIEALENWVPRTRRRRHRHHGGARPRAAGHVNRNNNNERGEEEEDSEELQGGRRASGSEEVSAELDALAGRAGGSSRPRGEGGIMGRFRRRGAAGGGGEEDREDEDLAHVPLLEDEDNGGGEEEDIREQQAAFRQLGSSGSSGSENGESVLAAGEVRRRRRRRRGGGGGEGSDSDSDEFEFVGELGGARAVVYKLDMFKHFKNILTTYAFLVTMLLVLSLVFLGNVAWIEVSLRELLEFCTAASFSYLFRLRKPSVFVYRFPSPDDD